ncbi:oxidoreductase-like protein [Thozetella sp. PMI_491]|nr:oxidoreductase-like protein [Thozetella sp. PMI_491]
MGVFNYFRSDADRRADEVRSGQVAPTREERQNCWAARDAYYACLDSNSIIDPLKDHQAAAKACRKEGADFERDCAAQWVTYFKKWRVQDLKKKAQLRELEAQGANKVDVQTDFAPKR